MKHLCLFLIAYLVPVMALGADMPLPLSKFSLIPKWVDCPGQPKDADAATGYVCYDFNAAKGLLDVEARAIGWHNLNLQLSLQVRNLSTQIDHYRDMSISLEGDVKRLADGYGGAMKIITKTADRARAAEKRDVLGGALPWLVAAAALLLVGGFLAGWFGHQEAATP